MKRIYLMKNAEVRAYARKISALEIYSHSYKSRKDFSYYTSLNTKKESKTYILISHSNLLINKKKSWERIKEVHPTRICSLGYDLILQY